MYKFYFFNKLFVFLFLTVAFQNCDFLIDCQDETLNNLNGYEFEIPVTLTPIKEIYRVGDTLSINIDFSNDVYDRRTDKHYLMKDVHFQPFTVLTDILEGGDTSSFISSFENFEVIIPEKYNYGKVKTSSGAEFLDKFYLYEDEHYRLNFQLVPKKASIYQFLHYHDYGSPFQRGRDFEQQCLSVPLKAYTYLNNGHHGNIELLRESSFPNHYELSINDLEGFHNAGAFVFRVIE